ncbi:MAG: EAL domain-containing protein, partial [Treponema sp.]|nr:EAL domain-containing protein [Treponema sp.]
YIIYFDLSALLISCITLWLFIRKSNCHRLQSKIFLILVIDELLMTIADLGSAILLKNLTRSTFALADIFTCVYFITHTFMPVIFMVYLTVLTGIYKKRGHIFFLFVMIPYLMIFVLMVTNPFTKLIYYYDSDLIYHRGPCMTILYALNLFYVVLSSLHIIRYRYTIPHHKEIPLSLFIICCVLATIIQFFFPFALIECFVEISMTLCLLIEVENPSEIYSSDTNVYNRGTFLFDAIHMQKNNTPYKAIIVKILNEKQYMASIGYASMTEIRYSIAQWFVQITNDDSVYDCNNGNFALILYGPLLKKSELIMQYITNRFSTDWLHNNRILSFQTQICEVNVPEDLSTVSDILSLIDASVIPTGRIEILKKEQLTYMKRQKAVEIAIKRALENNSFKVFFQPIWDARKNKIHSAEALIRLFDEDLGLISPEEFIPIAEKNGTITAIGQFVFEEVCKMFSYEQLHSLGIDFLEINLSTIQCMHKSLPQIFATTLAHYGLPISAINLEITESAAINSQETFQQTFKELLDMGFTFSLDDYGTGYSNATYIFNMDFEIIKIDKSILWEAEKKDSAKIVLANTIRMIKELGKKILVEGVETKEQRNLVVSLGCDYCQGYYFSKPIPKQEFMEFCKVFNGSHQSITDYSD